MAISPENSIDYSGFELNQILELCEYNHCVLQSVNDQLENYHLFQHNPSKSYVFINEQDDLIALSGETKGGTKWKIIINLKFFRLE